MKKPVKKGGLSAYHKSGADKAAHAKGLHGPEGSPQDMKADKAQAKKLGYTKGGGKMKKK